MNSSVKWIPVLFIANVLLATTVIAQSDDVRKALSYSPVQDDVEYQKPSADEAKSCKLISAKKINRSGFVLFDGNGQILRMFLNNGGDPNVDQWSYYQNGIEVYRDIDTDFDGKADVFRWFGAGGTRWGRDTDGDNQIDEWLAISAEEVSAEVIAAIKQNSESRFQALLLTDKEVAKLGLSSAQEKLVSERLKETRSGFRKMSASQKLVDRSTQWVHFGGTRPSTIPSGTRNSTKDITVYENVAAVVQTGSKHGQLSLGTLVKVGDAWRVIDLPVLLEGEDAIAAASLFSIPDDRFMQGDSAIASTGGASTAEQQELFEALEAIEKRLDAALEKQDDKAIAKINLERANTLKKIAASIEDPKQKSDWIRQFADTVAGAFQSGAFPDGLKEVSAYYTELKKQKVSRDDLGYLLYRMVSARYSRMFEEAKPDEVAEVQEKYLKDLEDFVGVYPNVSQAADAMLQLALWAEFSRENGTEKAENWYGKIVKNFPQSETAEKARGALVRLRSEGKPLRFTGPTIDSGKTYKISQDNGKVVLIHYWAGEADMDYSELNRLYKKYRAKGFNIVSVNLDENSEKAKQAIRQSKLPGVHLFEEGGTESRLSTQLGIALVPTMILVDQDGKVANRNIRLGDLEKSIDKLLK